MQEHVMICELQKSGLQYSITMCHELSISFGLCYCQTDIHIIYYYPRKWWQYCFQRWGSV